MGNAKNCLAASERENDQWCALHILAPYPPTTQLGGSPLQWSTRREDNSDAGPRQPPPLPPIQLGEGGTLEGVGPETHVHNKYNNKNNNNNNNNNINNNNTEYSIKNM